MGSKDLGMEKDNGDENQSGIPKKCSNEVYFF